MWPQQTPHLLLHSFHLSSEIALYSPPSLVLGHFSECYIGIIFSCLNFAVFLKFKFYDKKFSSWLLASHRIIIPVWMLNIFLIHFFLILGHFFPFVDYRRFPISAESARFPRVLLAEAMFLAASMSSNHFPSLDIENILHLFCFVLILQRFSSFFHFSTSDSISDNLRLRTCRLAEAMFLAASMSSNHFPSLDIENVLHLFCFVLILQRFSSFFHFSTSDSIFTIFAFSVFSVFFVFSAISDLSTRRSYVSGC